MRHQAHLQQRLLKKKVYIENTFVALGAYILSNILGYITILKKKNSIGPLANYSTVGESIAAKNYLKGNTLHLKSPQHIPDHCFLNQNQ